jgi:hypothetical protein
LVVNGKVIAYKQIRKDRSSFYDPYFVYPEAGKIVEVWVEGSDESCAPGLHFSHANYWNNNEDPYESLTVAAEITLEDIVTVQNGKIRCRKAKMLS